MEITDDHLFHLSVFNVFPTPNQFTDRPSDYRIPDPNPYTIKRPFTKQATTAYDYNHDHDHNNPFEPRADRRERSGQVREMWRVLRSGYRRWVAR